MKFSFTKVLLFSFVGIIIIVGLAFYAGVLTKQSLDEGKTEEKSNGFVIDTTTEEVTEQKGKSPSQPDIKVDFASENG